jgi:hypothetical protein
MLCKMSRQGSPWRLSIPLCWRGLRRTSLTRVHSGRGGDASLVSSVRRQAAVGLFPMSALPPKADIARHDPDVRFVPKADIHGPIRSHLDIPNGNQRSISPNTMSRELSIAGTSASMCPRVKKSIAPKCGNDGARILHLYGWLVPSETR